MEIGIIGAGTMGSGIAQVAAQNGHKTIVYDTNQEALNSASMRLNKTLEKLVAKGKFTTAQAEEIESNIHWKSDLAALKNAGLVIEAIIENIDIKKSVFKDVEAIVSADCILASNTSSLSLTSIAAACNNPNRFIGIHFFNPAPIMKLVEIIPALQTNEEVLTKTKECIDAWGKITVVAKDTPGFIVNKVARPFYSEAIKMSEEGLASIDWIDSCLKSQAEGEKTGFRMGPFELTDLIGHDVNYKVTETVWTSFYYDPKYKPSFTQKRLVEANWLGKKTAQGFYTYPREEHNLIPSPEMMNTFDEIRKRVIYMIINEAADTLFLNIASRDDIDKAMKFGVNYPKGPFEWADEIGIAEVVNYLDALQTRFGDDRYRCCPLLRDMVQNNKKFY